MIVKQNGKNNSLRDALLNEGFAFPCGGKGICGRCRIIAPTLEATALDLRFISAEDRAKGVRLACDKQFDGSIELNPLALKKSAPPKKIETPEVVAGLYDTHTTLSILDNGEVVETAVFASPDLTTNELRAVVQKNAIEFYEKYGVAKAITLMVFGTKQRLEMFTKSTDPLRFTSGDTIEASVYAMPAEDVYLPPLSEMDGGSVALLELLDSKTNSIVVSLTNNIVTVISNGATGVVATSLSDTATLVSDIKAGVFSAEVMSLFATINYFATHPDFTKVVIYSDTVTQNDINSILNQYIKPTIACVEVKGSNAQQMAIAVLENNRLKTKLNRLASKISYISLLNDSVWQNLLTELYK
ncbi:MAG: 2Fe-2S iron-sulfur cluster binding domain-containing protein [Bacillota bacterium]